MTTVISLWSLLACGPAGDACPEVLYDPSGPTVTSREECPDGVVVGCFPNTGTCAGEEGYTCESPPERFTDWLMNDCPGCIIYFNSADSSPPQVPLAMVTQCYAL